MTAPPAPIPDLGTPPAEVEIDEGLIRALLAEQHPDLAGLLIRRAETGWDNALFRLGDDLALRMPRRALGGDLIRHEQRWTPVLAPRLPLPIPTPVRLGAPGCGYPYAWSVTPWFEGTPADLALPDLSQGEALAGFLTALHHAAPVEAPANPVRGVALTAREPAFDTWLGRLRERSENPSPTIQRMWRTALAAPMDRAPTWIHGDLHGRNVLTREGRISAVLDWGDMCAGDPATDLAALWMLLPDIAARANAMAALDASPATWDRARGWALMMGVILRASGLADAPRMAAMGAAILRRLEDGP